MWEHVAALEEVVADAWREGGTKHGLHDIKVSLDKLMGKLHGWSRKKFGNVVKEIEKSRTRLEDLMNMNADRKEIRKESEHLDELLYREEMLWRQRSRIDWLREGDRNTQFFHQRAIWRARKNKIKGLVDSTGVKQTEQKVMEGMALDFFQNLFTVDTSLNADRAVALFDRVITAEMNAKLRSPFSDKEISDAMFQIGPLKAPGPDSFLARFFQKHWAIVKEDVISAAQLFFDSGHMPDGVNLKTIVLIPKIDEPVKLSDFRPISLCNVIYKVIAKCLVNRLRPLLGEIISPEQSAFVPGRLITDNAFMAFECTHFIRHEKNPERSFCAYKLDLSKAYDRVDWIFLERVMQQLGFDHRWVRWIMACVTSVRYTVKINGARSDSFAPSRGLRQGDPVSPFLFLFVADGLVALLKKEVGDTHISPLRVCPRAPGVSHLLFADDTLLFFRATEREAPRIKAVLDVYASATGQLINR